MNWDNFIRRDSGTLLFSGILSVAISAIILFLYFDRVKVKGEDDITFISGPFDGYSWVDLGGRSGSALTFKLGNYSNRFKIKADFFGILQLNKFKAIPYGDTLIIGIPNAFAKYLNTGKEPFFVYSIASGSTTCLDLSKTIAKHNSPLFLFAAGLFAIGGCAYIFFGRRAKVKTPIW